jgi:hypothetical protein
MESDIEVTPLWLAMKVNWLAYSTHDNEWVGIWTNYLIRSRCSIWWVMLEITKAQILAWIYNLEIIHWAICSSQNHRRPEQVFRSLWGKAGDLFVRSPLKAFHFCPNPQYFHWIWTRNSGAKWRFCPSRYSAFLSHCTKEGIFSIPLLFAFPLTNPLQLIPPNLTPSSKFYTIPRSEMIHIPFQNKLKRHNGITYYNFLTNPGYFPEWLAQRAPIWNINNYSLHNSIEWPLYSRSLLQQNAEISTQDYLPLKIYQLI